MDLVFSSSLWHIAVPFPLPVCSLCCQCNAGLGANETDLAMVMACNRGSVLLSSARGQALHCSTHYHQSHQSLSFSVPINNNYNYIPGSQSQSLLHNHYYSAISVVNLFFIVGLMEVHCWTSENFWKWINSSWILTKKPKNILWIYPNTLDLWSQSECNQMLN